MSVCGGEKVRNILLKQNKIKLIYSSKRGVSAPEEKALKPHVFRKKNKHTVACFVSVKDVCFLIHIGVQKKKRSCFCT